MPAARALPPGRGLFRRPRLLVALLVAGSVAVGGCALGERPTLQPPTSVVPVTSGEATGVPEVDALLARLDDAGSAVFTGTYSIQRKLDPVTGEARVASTPGTTTVTVGDTRFFLTGQQQTCTLSTASCVPGIDSAAIADLSISPDFFAASPAAQIRVSMGRRLEGDLPFYSQDVASQLSDCVDIPVGTDGQSGFETYCVTQAGPVSVIERADVSIRLVGWSDVADPLLLVPPV